MQLYLLKYIIKYLSSLFLHKKVLWSIWRTCRNIPPREEKDGKAPNWSTSPPNYPSNETGWIYSLNTGAITDTYDCYWLLYSNNLNGNFLFQYSRTQGQMPAPETFNSVTVFLCDVVSFTLLSSESTAHQVVELLNNLYNMFDERLDLYDVYKVMSFRLSDEVSFRCDSFTISCYRNI